MHCPACQADCPEQAEACFTCGQALFALTQGTLLGGRYEIVRPVGKGGMSRVYEARDRVLGEAVAIKVLRAELAWEHEMRQRFRHEIRLARRVSHPNVCRIHEYGEDGPRRYISMEMVEGVNLKEVLRRRGLTTEEAFELALQLADGLAAVHQHGIVHRDFKASNIMIARSGLAKLMDFGIAKHAEADTGNFTTPGEVLGTPEYMSPEHARGAKVDFRSDEYALGCVLFEIFTGQAPFKGANAFATISKHFYEPPPLEGPLGALIPEALVPVLRTALAKDPARRYASVPEAREALRQAQAATVAEEPGEPREPNAVGSPRLRRLCEEVMSQEGAALASDPDSSLHDVPPSPRVYPAPSDPRRSAAPAPAPPRRRARAAAMAAAVAGVLALAFAVLTRPESREVGVAPGTVAPAQRVAALPRPAIPRARADAPPATASSADAASPFPAAARRPDDGPAATSGPVPLRSAATPPSSSGAHGGDATIEPPSLPPARRATAAAATGTLRVLVVPWAEVIVDGRSVGTVSLREVALAPGVHAVRMLHPDFQPLQRKVTIEAGQEARLVIDLSEQGIRRAP